MAKAKNRNKLSKATSTSLTTLLVVLFTLGITIPLHCIFPNALTIHWVIAICIAIIFPLALTNFKIVAESKGNYTDEQKKAASTRIGVAILSVWYADFTYVCMFMNWLIAFFILASLYLIKMVYDVASVLLKRKNSTAYPNFIIAGDFVLSFLLSILLVYKIPDQSLQTIVTALLAALIGGLLTLLGVMLTIKKSDDNRKEDEIKKTRPIFSYNMLRKEPTLDFVMQKVCLFDVCAKDEEKCEAFVEIENSNLSPFEIKRIYHDNKWVDAYVNTMVLPSGKCILNFRFTDNPLFIFMEVEDLLKNKHYYHLKVLLLGPNAFSNSGKILHTVKEIKEISESEMNKLIKEEFSHK